MLIKILDQNLDKFIYDRIILQKKTSEDFHLIHTYDIPSLNDKESKKSVIMYLVNEGSSFLKAVEIIFNYENKNTFHVSLFRYNSTIFDTIDPAVKQILNSITI